MNSGDQPVTLYKGKRIATLELVEEAPALGILAVQPKCPQITEEKQGILWKLVERSFEWLLAG